MASQDGCCCCELHVVAKLKVCNTEWEAVVYSQPFGLIKWEDTCWFIIVIAFLPALFPRLFLSFLAALRVQFIERREGGGDWPSLDNDASSHLLRMIMSPFLNSNHHYYYLPCLSPLAALLPPAWWETIKLWAVQEGKRDPSQPHSRSIAIIVRLFSWKFNWRKPFGFLILFLWGPIGIYGESLWTAGKLWSFVNSAGELDSKAR